MGGKPGEHHIWGKEREVYFDEIGSEMPIRYQGNMSRGQLIHKSKGQRIIWWQICKLPARECYVFIWGVWREAERERLSYEKETTPEKAVKNPSI